MRTPRMVRMKMMMTMVFGLVFIRVPPSEQGFLHVEKGFGKVCIENSSIAFKYLNE
jgi:hypothetical protein